MMIGYEGELRLNDGVMTVASVRSTPSKEIVKFDIRPRTEGMVRLC